MKKTIFLDFDGVLHGYGEGYRDMFIHMNFLCATLMPFREKFDIVISSSWRESFPFADLRDFFPDELAPYVLAGTPVHPDGLEHGGRQNEILHYCEEHGVTDWIALDDNNDLFLDNCPHLLLINENTGINEQNMQDLIHFLSQ